jgi:hypothetical protein
LTIGDKRFRASEEASSVTIVEVPPPAKRTRESNKHFVVQDSRGDTINLEVDGCATIWEVKTKLAPLVITEGLLALLLNGKSLKDDVEVSSIKHGTTLMVEIGMVEVWH